MGEIAIPLMIAGAAFGTVGTIEEASARRSALEERERQEQIAANEKAIKRDNEMEEVLSKQAVGKAASGFSPDSASFTAITEESFNQFAQDRRADNLTLAFKKNAIDQEISNTEEQEFIGIGSNVFKAASMFYGAKTPSKYKEAGGSLSENPYDPRRFLEGWGAKNVWDPTKYDAQNIFDIGE